MNLDTLDLKLLRREMNHLLWIKPFKNWGSYDMGWGCRDHTWLLSAVVSDYGVEHQIVTGKAVFVQGASDDHPPSGLGNAVSDESGSIATGGPSHTWLDVPGRGIYDLSPNLNVNRGPWRPVEFNGVVRSDWLPEGDGTVIQCSSRRNYKEMINRSSHQRGRRFALYWPRRRNDASEVIRRSPFEWVESPQTERLSQSYGPELYHKVVSHLLSLLNGEAESLLSVARGRALSLINQQYDETARK